MIIPIIAGPTSSGKTKLGILLAKVLNGEIISADSMQIYKGFDIGSAKVTKKETENIPHHLIDIRKINEQYAVAEFKKDAIKKIHEIIKKGKTPIIVGGTGLYINSLIYDFDFSFSYDEKLREKLNKEAETEEGLNNLYNKAFEIDKESTLKISKNDKKRIIRIIEIFMLTGKTKKEYDQEKSNDKCDLKSEDLEYKLFALNVDRSTLYNTINNRTKKMIDSGLKDEIKDLTITYLLEGENEKESFKKLLETGTIEEKENFVKNLVHKYTSVQGIGFKEVLENILGIISDEEMIEKLSQNTRKYAKRQYTWFKKNKPIWIDMTKAHLEEGKKREQIFTQKRDEILSYLKN